MFTCSTCGSEWPENYCPACGHTIDRSAGKAVSVEALPPVIGSVTAKSNQEASPKASASGRSRNDCPACGSVGTGKAEGRFKGVSSLGFQAFPNRVCYGCGIVWKPACPKWAAAVCVLGGGAACLLAFLMFTGDGRLAFIATFGAIPILYGVAVLVGMSGKMQILSNGSPYAEQTASTRSRRTGSK